MRDGAHGRPRLLLGATVDALVGTLGLRDGHTCEHSESVAALACRIGRRMGLGPRALRNLGYAAQLHDIGKVGVPDAVLRKAEALTASEWEILKGHAAWGAELVDRIPGLKRVATIVRHHHERFDGSGYPDGLRGRRIPLEARVLGVADAYTAMTEDRPYRRALSESEAQRRLLAGSGSQFDPEAVEALLDDLRGGPVRARQTGRFRAVSPRGGTSALRPPRMGAPSQAAP